MKRLLVFLIVLALAVTAFAGCVPFPKEDKQLTQSGGVTQSNGEYTISLPICGQEIQVHTSYKAYMPYVTDELIQQADQALSEVIAQHPDNFGIYLSFDQENYLCLCAEVIVYFEPEEEHGIDHDHVLYRERISTQPVK